MTRPGDNRQGDGDGSEKGGRKECTRRGGQSRAAGRADEEQSLH